MPRGGKLQRAALREPGRHRPLIHIHRRTVRSGSSGHRSSHRISLPGMRVMRERVPEMEPGLPGMPGLRPQVRRRYRRISPNRSAGCRTRHRYTRPVPELAVPLPVLVWGPGLKPGADRPERRRYRRILFRDPSGHRRLNRSERSGGMRPGREQVQVPARVPLEQPLPTGLPQELQWSLLRNSHRTVHQARGGCRRIGRAALQRV